MKGKLFNYIIIFILTASCNKHNQSTSENETACITRLSPKVSDYGISGAKLDSVYALFSANNLSTANLEFESWGSGTVVNVNPGAYSGYQEQVLAIQFFNGLPVFASEVFFIFNAGRFQPGGIYDGYTGPAPSSDTSGHQTFPGLKKAFLAKLSQSYMAGGAQNAKPFVPSASTYINSCLDVTLGYLDASMVPGSATGSEKKLVKVWRVTPSNSTSITYYPVVYVEDDNGIAWGMPFLVP